MVTAATAVLAILTLPVASMTIFPLVVVASSVDVLVLTSVSARAAARSSPPSAGQPQQRKASNGA